MFIAGCIVAGVGVLLFILGIIFLIVGKASRKCTACTKGVIVDMCYNAFGYNNGASGRVAVGVSTGASQPNTRCPVFSYYVNGTEYRRASNVAYSKGKVQKDINSQRQVSVYYNPANPQQATLSKNGALTVVGRVFFCVGAGLLALGIVFLVISFV